MELHTDRINTLKLSGITSILGIDYFANRLRIVEVKSSGGTMNRYSATYSAVHDFTLDLPEEHSPADRGRELAEELKKRGIRTRFCVSTIRSANSRTVTADIPIESSDEPPGREIETWIRENYEKLIRVPIPLKELAFDYEIVSSTPDSVRCEVAFVRAAEREYLTDFVKAAGLHMLLLNLGARSIEYGFLSSAGNLSGGNRAVLFADADTLACTVYTGRDPAGGGGQVTRRNFRGTTPDQAAAALRDDFGDLDGVFISGPGSPETDTFSAKVWKPIGLSPGYALAASLAIHGFIFASSIGRHVRSFDFRPDSIRADSVEQRDKSLFRVSTLILGFILLVLLGAQFGLQSHLRSASARLDEKLESVGPIYSQVMLLDRQVNALKMQLSGEDALRERSGVARTLHVIAASTPGGVWLYKLVYSKGDSRSRSITLWGYARTNRYAASYLAGLQQKSDFKDVRVVRVGAPTQLERASFISSKLKSFVTFEVELAVNR